MKHIALWTILSLTFPAPVYSYCEGHPKIAVEVNSSKFIVVGKVIYEVFDLDRKEAIKVLEDYYGPVLDTQKVEKYFFILDQIRDID